MLAYYRDRSSPFLVNFGSWGVTGAAPYVRAERRATAREGLPTACGEGRLALGIAGGGVACLTSYVGICVLQACWRSCSPSHSINHSINHWFIKMVHKPQPL